jgi:hypothetical protein
MPETLRCSVGMAADVPRNVTRSNDMPLELTTRGL